MASPANQHDSRSQFAVSRLWLGAGFGVLAILIVLWSCTGVGTLDAFSYLGYLCVAVALPGIALATLLDRRPLGLAHVCVGIPLGFVQSMLCFVILAAAGLRGAAPWAPIVLGVATAAILARRRTNDNVAAARIRGGALPVAAVALVAVALTAANFFPQHPLPAQVGAGMTLSASTKPGASYYSDLVWHIGNVVTLKHHWPPADLRAEGEPLKYYIGDYVQAAQTSIATGIEPATLLLRLDPILQLALLTLQLFWVGRVFGRRVRTGVLAAALTLLVGDLSSLGAATSSQFANSFFGDMYASPTFEFGLVLFVPLLGVVAHWIRSGGRLRAGAPVTIALLTLGAGLTKTMPLAILIGAGAGLVALDALVLRRLSRIGCFLAGVAGLAYVVLLPLTHRPGEASMISLSFLGTVSGTHAWWYLLQSPLDFIPHHPIVAVIVIAGSAPVLLIGASALLARRRGRLLEAERFLAFAAATGAAIVLLFKADGDGQLFFWYFGYVALAVLAALGLDAVLTTPRAWARRTVLATVAACALLGTGSIVLQSGWQVRAAVASVIPGVPGPFHATPPNPPDVTQPLLAGERWLREHTPSGAIVAVNNQANLSARMAYKYFYYSAFSERQVLLEGYAYTPTFAPRPTPAAARELTRRLSLLADVFEHGSAASIRELHRSYGVDYLLVDRRADLPQHALPASATRQVFANPQVSVYAVVAG